MKSRSLLTSIVVLAATGIASCTDSSSEPVMETESNLVSGAGEATLTVSSSWPSGFCANVDVVNHGTSPITDWAVTVEVKSATVSNAWNTVKSGTGSTITLKPVDWNKAIAPGAKSTVGFCADGSGGSGQAVLSTLSVVGGGSTGSGGAGGGATKPSTTATGGSTTKPSSTATGGTSTTSSSSTGTTTCSGYYALTFDDGPGSNTNTLINILRANNARATFFNIGQNAASNPSLVKALVDAGMWVQNHSYTHPHMTSLSQSQIQSELTRTNTAIQSGGAPKPTIYRATYGETNSTINAAAAAAGVKVVTWSVDSQDWNGASAASIVSAANSLQNGGIILMHESYPNTTNVAVPQIISNLRKRGLCPGMIDPNTLKAVAPSGSSSGGTSGTGGTGGTGGSSGTSTPVSVNCSGPSLTGGTTYTSNGSGNVAGGYNYELWRDGSGGSMTVYGVGAAFKASWANSGDFLARVGLKWDETKTYDQYGTISADYAYKKSGTGGGYSFIGIYGWSTNPLVEYYIVDDWFGSGPPTGGGTLKGSFDVDGGRYNIYTYTRVNMPSIKGTATFTQYFSVRQTARQCGHISITEHFKKWASLGLNLGKMYEAKILVEAGGGTGSIDFTTATLTAK